PERRKQDMWLLKLDENGCLSDEVCDSLFTNIEVLDPSELSPPKLFPNPSKSHLQIQIPAHFTSKPLQLQLTNIEGRVVLKEWIEDGKQLDIADLAAGVYIATWIQDGEALKREKVVVLE
ncbi:MAG: T9SS type A sorting domain-containing protein, partial [Chitinophagales bacterium]